MTKCQKKNDKVTKNDESMQRKVDKAKRYSTEMERFIPFDDRIEIHSEHGTRTIRIINGDYTCDCDFYQENGTCSHIMAVINSNIQLQKDNFHKPLL